MSATTVTLEGAGATTAHQSPGSAAGLRPALRRGLKAMLAGWAISTIALLAACGSDGGGSPGPATDTTINVAQNLTTTDVQQVLAQTIQEATARKAQATIAVVDRVGNVLAVYRMGPNAATSPNPVEITSTFTAGQAPPITPAVTGGLEGVELPLPGTTTGSLDDQAAIAKAITAAYLSTSGNAFTSRTASQIVESHFNPGTLGQPGGPLFGVQFSSLACGDFIQAFNPAGPSPGPHSSPLGLSADPGGFPLYKSGAIVGAVGVIADGFYSIDQGTAGNNTSLNAQDLDEQIAYAGTYGFTAPSTITADKILVGGLTLNYSNINDYGQLAANPKTAPAFTSLAATVGTLITTPTYAAYTTAGIQTGTTYSTAGSGLRPDAQSTTPLFPALDAFVFVDGNNNNRYPPIAGTDGASVTTPLTAAEVQQVMTSAFGVLSMTRAQIRNPLDSNARVTISVVDTNGAILGMIAARDAPIFGADVSLQKARSVQLFSNAGAAGYLNGLPPTNFLTTYTGAVTDTQLMISQHVTQYQTFIGNPNALGDGTIAYADRGIGNLTRPFYPDGIDSNPNEGGTPYTTGLYTLNGFGSPFHDGIQLDLSINAILQHVLFVGGVVTQDVVTGSPINSATPSSCPGVAIAFTPPATFTFTPPTGPLLPIANGLQIFAGGEPIYRGNTLVGAVGISGDGTQQDDMIGFLGLANASTALNGSIGEAPTTMRDDTLAPAIPNQDQPVHLNYVQCPASPFINSSVQTPCDGI